MRRTPVLIQAILVALVLVAIALLFRSTPPKRWAAFCFAGSPILLVARVPTQRTIVGTLVVGASLALWYHAANAGVDPGWLISGVYGLGGGSIVCAVANAIAAVGEERAFAFRTVATVLLFPAKLYLGLLVLSTVASATPLTYDLILTAVDHSFAGNASFAVGQILAGRRSSLDMVMWVYDALPFAVMLAAAWRWWRLGPADRASIPLSAGIAAMAGALLYLIVPAAGPGFLWEARYPSHPPSEYDLILKLSPVAVQHFRNAMPSLHFTGALIVALGTWSMGRTARTLGVALTLVTALATLGSGEHYVIDLVVAVPFTLAIEASVRRIPHWKVISLVDSLIVLGWLAFLRWRPSVVTVPFISWLAVALTIVTPALLWKRRYRLGKELSSLIATEAAT